MLCCVAPCCVVLCCVVFLVVVHCVLISSVVLCGACFVLLFLFVAARLARAAERSSRSGSDEETRAPKRGQAA